MLFVINISVIPPNIWDHHTRQLDKYTLGVALLMAPSACGQQICLTMESVARLAPTSQV